MKWMYCIENGWLNIWKNLHEQSDPSEENAVYWKKKTTGKEAMTKIYIENVVHMLATCIKRDSSARLMWMHRWENSENQLFTVCWAAATATTTPNKPSKRHGILCISIWLYTVSYSCQSNHICNRIIASQIGWKFCAEDIKCNRTTTVNNNSKNPNVLPLWRETMTAKGNIFERKKLSN